MGCLGNIIWFLCCGFWQGLSWLGAGILWSITIIGIPIGRQCFKFASLAFFPFGKDVEYGGGTPGHHVPDRKYFMAAYQRHSFGDNGSAEWITSVLYNYRYSFWTAVFQNGETGIDAFWRNNNIELKIIPLRHCS